MGHGPPSVTDTVFYFKLLTHRLFSQALYRLCSEYVIFSALLISSCCRFQLDNSIIHLIFSTCPPQFLFHLSIFSVISLICSTRRILSFLILFLVVIPSINLFPSFSECLNLFAEALVRMRISAPYVSLAARTV